MKRRPFIWIALLLVVPYLSFSQLTVTTNSVATTLAQTILGSGVTISNASMNCDALGSGTFTYSGGTLGVTNGILLTTGWASDASMASQIVGESTGNNFTDPDLATITSGTMNDVCYLAFDFVPICNQVSITFEFGSSEYDGYQCGGFNDAFGLFLTGPNPAGGSYTSSNMATLPSGTAVTIDNVNNGGGSCTSPNNPSYFIDNSTGPDVVYYGLTTAITSVKPVTPCSTYTMKIAICDITDGIFDSGVFIQGNSVACTNTPTVTASATPANCSGNVGTASVTVTNYTGTPTYSWSPGGQTTQSISNLAAGTYTCVVGMTLACGTTTTAVTAVVGSVGGTMSLTTSTVNPRCNNSTDGSATVNIAGGTAPFTYTWSPSGGNAATASNLGAGSYTITVKDNAGCQTTATAILTNPAAIVASTTTTPSNCGASNGSASATVSSGGTGAITYSWSPGGQTTSSINNVGAGSYTVLISDANSCTVSLPAVVGSVGSSLSLTTSSVNPTCNNFTNGSASVNASGGTAPITYTWNTSPAQNTATASNLGSGTYVVIVQDNAGCSQTTTVTLTNPAPIVATASATPSICTGNNGTATGNVTSGGVGSITYVWNSSPVQNTQTATGLSAGVYTVLISDANSCSVTATATVVQQGPTWSLTANTGTNVACFGGSTGAVGLTVNNPGTNTFTYVWSTNPVQTSAITTSTIPAGSYTCTVIDGNMCVQTVTTSITEPTVLTASTSVAPTTCTASIGSSTVTASGGTPPYSYGWSTTPIQTGQVATNLGAGTYTVGVMDTHSCTVSATSNILTQTQNISITATSTNAKCTSANGGVVINTVTGGTGPYTFSWSSTPVQTSQNLTNVLPGTYNVTVTDSHGCTILYNETVGNTTGLPLNTSSTYAQCHDSSGTAHVSANGTPPYTYLWNTTPPQTTATAAGLPSGTYQVMVTDSYGCMDTMSVSVSNKDEVLNTSFATFPQGEINAGDPIIIAIAANQGWTLDTAYLMDYGAITAYEHHTFDNYGTYYAYYYYTSIHGCKDSVMYPIKVTDYMTLYIPSAFSPNGDGLNDYFKATGTFIKSFEMYIYDRWGNLIKKLDDIEKSWDGTFHGYDVQQDTYVYKGTVMDVFGKKTSIQGQINVVR